jgi:hypothetical protein
VKINLKEKETAIKCIEKGIIDKKPSVTILLLAKYYHNNGMAKEQIIDEINDFMKKNYKQYNSVLWSSLIESIVKQVIKNNSQLVHIESVNITKTELEFIKNIETLKMQKVAFTYLVYAKVFNKINENNNNWVKSSYRNEIFKDANVTETGKDQLLILKKMIELNIFTMAKNITNNSINVGNYISEDDEVVLVIDDFRALGLQYLKAIGEDKNIIQCEECEKLIEVKNNKTKYCKACSKELWKEYNREKQKEYYNKNKDSV